MFLGKEKFSSNVIEKLLDYNTDRAIMAMIHEILSTNSFFDHLNNQYGNYFVQKALQAA